MKKYLQVAAILSAILAIAGCNAVSPYGGTYKFDGPGNFQEFANARYECARATQSYSSTAFVQGGLGAASSNVAPSCSVFSACLASKGYYRNANGRLDASGIVVNCNP